MMGEKLINGIRVRTGGKMRELDQSDEFERTLADAFLTELSRSDTLGPELWAALANIEWRRGETRILYSFRAAGDVVAALIGSGDYLDWYCSARPAVVSHRIHHEMLRRGWLWTKITETALFSRDERV